MFNECVLFYSLDRQLHLFFFILLLHRFALYQLAEFLIDTSSGCACPSSFPYYSVPILRNKLTRRTFYVWYLLRARLGSGFIESYIKASGPEKARGVGRLARTFESTDEVLAFVSSGVCRVFSTRAVGESALNFWLNW